MSVNHKYGLCFIAGLVFAGLNLLHMLLWAVGLYLPIGVHALVAVGFLVVALQRRSLNAVFALALLFFFSMIPLLHPAYGWDTRSIWLFHAKRIFLDGSLYAQLDDYAAWTHNDYPSLVPAMSASIARSVGYWNEIAPRAAAGIALAPVLFWAAHFLRSWAAYAAWVAAALIICWAETLTGYMDSLVALNFSVALLAVLEIYRKGYSRETAVPVVPAVVLSVSMLQSLFLKNEGAVTSALLSLAMIPVLLRKPRLLASVAVPWVAFLALWKLPIMFAGVESDLFQGGQAIERGLQRLRSPAEYGQILQSFQILSFHFFAVFAALLAGLAVWTRRLAYLAPPLFAIGGYACCLFLVYITTYHELRWHLDTSADRVLLSFEMGVATMVLYLLYQGLTWAAARWGLRADSGA